MEEYRGDHSVHAASQEDPEETWVDDPGPNYKRDHGHLGYLPVGIYVEVGGGDHQHPPEGKCPSPLHHTWVPQREGNEEGYPGTEVL